MEKQNEIKRDENFLCGIELPQLSIYLLYRGGAKVEYYAFKKDIVLFHGTDFKPSPLHNQDDIESIIDLLGFLTCQPGDTDDEYFATYSPAQMEWAKSHECEQLSNEVSDFDNEDPEYNTKATFEKVFIIPS